MEKRTLYKEGTFKKGNFHTHSTRSDGIASPEEIAKAYKELGYDFLAITDHWVYGIHENLNSEDFLLFPGTELDIETPKRTDHHIVAIGLPETNTIPDAYTFEKERFGNRLSTPERIIEYFGQRGNATIYAHPYWSKVDSTDIKYLQGLLGMEIYNHASEVETNNGNSETYYDHFLFVRNKTFCFATDDAHDLRRQSIGGFIMVKCREFSHRGILKAIKDGSFYASSGPLLEDFYVEDTKDDLRKKGYNKIAKVTCLPCKDIYFKTPHTGDHIYSEKGSLTSAEFLLRGDEEYVRVVLKNEKGEKAWSQPIWLWPL